MKFKSIYSLIFVILISLGSIFPLFKNGFFSFHDDTAVVRMYEMGKSLSAGMFPVRWVEGLGYGYGYPIFNYYAPFPYYVGGLLDIAGFTSLVSTKMALGFGMMLSGVTMFYLAKKYFGTAGGVVAAVIYVYFPYHAVNLYVRGAVGELFAYAFLPIIFLGLSKLIDTNDKKISESIIVVSIFSIGIFLVAISHNLTYLMLLIILAPVTLLSLFFTKNKSKFLLLVASSIVLGSLMASFYIVPAFVEMGFTNVRSQVGGGADFRDHYLCISQFWESGWGFGGSTIGCLDGFSMRLGKTNILLFIISLALVAFSIVKNKCKSQEKVAVLAFVLTFIAILLTLPLSRLFWESISYMEYVQYPWRFINFIAFGMSLCVGYVLFFLKRRFDKKLVILAGLAIVGATLLFNFKLFQPQFIHGNSSEYYEDKKYINYTVSKISDEYMPVDFDKPENVDSIPNEKIALKDDGIVTIESQGVDKISAKYKADTKSTLHVNIAYFPTWNAKVNGEKVDLVKVSDGMDVELPAGSGEIEIYFQQTVIQKIGNTLSILAILVLIIGIMLQKSYGKKTS